MQPSHQILCHWLSQLAADDSGAKVHAPAPIDASDATVKSVLLLGERAAEEALLLRPHTSARVCSESWQNLGLRAARRDSSPRTASFPPGNLADFDVVYLTDLPTGMATAPVSDQLAQCLSQLRDHCRGELLLEFAARDGLVTDNQFFALGFRRMPQGRSGDQQPALYHYSLHNYKTLPDWLNSKHWANPERWNLD